MASTRGKVALGIDLGTTNSVVAVYEEGQVTIIVDDQGKNFTPSVVAFTDLTQLVGREALKQYPSNPDNTVSEVKRLMGRKFSELSVQEDLQRWPFTVVDINGEPRIQVEYRAETRQYRPEQISAMLLLKLRQMACEFLELPPFTQLDAVVTVPVYFNDSQRLATKEACEIAGLNATRIISEPAAAAVAYALQNKVEGQSTCHRVLVFDMGGGTTDVCVMEMEEDFKLKVKACKGENHLGGEDLDSLIVEQCLEKLYEDHKLQVKRDKSVMTRIRSAAEKAKIILSSGTRARIQLDLLVRDICFVYDISRKTFEALADGLLRRSMAIVKECLEEAKMTSHDIDKVVLAGGSTHIPYLQAMLKEMLPGVPLHSSIKQEEAVAYGAAVQAAKDKGILQHSFLLSEVIPWSLGVNIIGGITVKVLNKNTPIPAENTEVFRTASDCQAAMEFKIYEGEDRKSEKNKFLGSMTLGNIRIAKQGVVAADTKFEVDVFGILQVTAREKESENEMSVKIDRYKKHLAWGEKATLTSIAQEENLHGLVSNLSDQLYDLEIRACKGQQLTAHQIQMISDEVAKMRKWERENPRPSSELYTQKLNELRETLAFCAKISNDGTITYKKL